MWAVLDSNQRLLRCERSGRLAADAHGRARPYSLDIPSAVNCRGPRPFVGLATFLATRLARPRDRSQSPPRARVMPAVPPWDRGTSSPASKREPDAVRASPEMVLRGKVIGVGLRSHIPAIVMLRMVYEDVVNDVATKRAGPVRRRVVLDSSCLPLGKRGAWSSRQRLSSCSNCSGSARTAYAPRRTRDRPRGAGARRLSPVRVGGAALPSRAPTPAGSLAAAARRRVLGRLRAALARRARDPRHLRLDSPRRDARRVRRAAGQHHGVERRTPLTAAWGPAYQAVGRASQ